MFNIGREIVSGTTGQHYMVQKVTPSYYGVLPLFEDGIDSEIHLDRDYVDNKFTLVEIAKPRVLEIPLGNIGTPVSIDFNYSNTTTGDAIITISYLTNQELQAIMDAIIAFVKSEKLATGGLLDCGIKL